MRPACFLEGEMTTKIEWVARPNTIPVSWNPVTGCDPVSESCANCYAERMARRLAGRFGYPEAPHHFDVTLHPGRLDTPLGWRKPRTVFVCSMSDLFHESIPDEFIDQIWATMLLSPQHTYQILTKRPDRILRYFELLRRDSDFPRTSWHYTRILRTANQIRLRYPRLNSIGISDPVHRPSKHIWLGVTIEHPKYSYRADDLRKTPAAIHFISFEPLLVSFADYPGVFDGMDWIIVGGESGPGARPMNPDWVRGIRDQCQAAGIPLFFKQWGAWAPAGPVEADPHFYGGRAADDPYRAGRFAVVDDMLKNRRANYRAFDDNTLMIRVGKKRAGHLLDGQEWREWPA